MQSCCGSIVIDEIDLDDLIEFDNDLDDLIGSDNDQRLCTRPLRLPATVTCSLRLRRAFADNAPQPTYAHTHTLRRSDRHHGRP